MKLLKNRVFAVAVLIAVIVLSSLYGLSQNPEAMIPDVPESGLNMNLSTAAIEYCVDDGANILSPDTEKQLSIYNANWNRMAGSIIAVVTTRDGGDVEESAEAWVEYLELAENDAILLMDTAAEDYCLLSSGEFVYRFNGNEGYYLDEYLYESFAAGLYDQGVLDLFQAIHRDLFAAYSAQPSGSRPDSAAVDLFDVITILVLVLIIVLAFTWMDGVRYNSWNRRYGSMGVPPVVYRPILWWHRPGGSWYRTRRTPRAPAPPPPPPPPVRPGPPPGGFGGPGGVPHSSAPRPPRPSAPKYSPPPRPGGSSSHSRGGGFSTGSVGRSGSRGGGFGSGPRGGASRGGGSRGGGFRR